MKYAIPSSDVRHLKIRYCHYDIHLRPCNPRSGDLEHFLCAKGHQILCYDYCVTCGSPCKYISSFSSRHKGRNLPSFKLSECCLHLPINRNAMSNHLTHLARAGLTKQYLLEGDILHLPNCTWVPCHRRRAWDQRERTVQDRVVGRHPVQKDQEVMMHLAPDFRRSCFLFPC